MAETSASAASLSHGTARPPGSPCASAVPRARPSRGAGVLLAAFLVTLGATHPALGQTAAPEPTAGTLLISASGASLIPAVLLLHLGYEQKHHCGTGSDAHQCDPPPTYLNNEALGLALLGASVTAGAVAAAAWAASDDQPAVAARNGPMASSGLVLTGLGAATLVAGAMALMAKASQDKIEPSFVSDAVTVPAGALALALGVPLWIAGAAPSQQAPLSDGAPGAGGEPPVSFRSPPMMAAGIALLVTATAGGASSLGFGISARDDDRERTTGAPRDRVARETHAAVFAGCAGAALAIAGTTLLAWGAADAPTADAAAESGEPAILQPPEISVGPGSITFAGRF